VFSRVSSDKGNLDARLRAEVPGYGVVDQDPIRKRRRAIKIS